MGQSTQRVIAAAVADVDRAVTPGYRGAVLPAAVSAAVTSASLGGLLQRLFGYTYDAREKIWIYQPQDYPLAGSATLGGLATSPIIISQEADFVASKITVTVGVDGTVTKDVSIQLVFSNTDQQFTSNATGTHVLSIQGTGQLPYILAKPWLIARNSRVQLNMYSLSANSRSVYFDLHGYKVLDVAALDLTSPRG